MKADLTRTTFRRFKHYSGVVAQQGRVQLDADFNEQASIMAYYLRRLAADVIGPCGGPAANLGFGIAPLAAGLASSTADFIIGAGHYYVDGILCELGAASMPVTILANNQKQVQIAQLGLDGRPLAKDQYVTLFDSSGATVNARIDSIDYPQQIPTLTLSDTVTLTNTNQPRMRRVVTFMTQPDVTAAAPGNGMLQIYLDVWERLVTYVEDDSIREVALNGPDTSARAKIVWQVKTLPIAAGIAVACLQPDALAAQLQPANRGLLRARAKPTPAPSDPCTIAPDASYRGPENQLYRVEIHTGGSLPGPNVRVRYVPTFKWSRENGSVVLPIVSGGSTNTLVLETLGRDDRYGLTEGDWVEIQDDASVLQGVLQGLAAPLLQVSSIDRSRRTVVLAGTSPPGVGNDPSKHPLLRRWDHKVGDPALGGLTLSDQDHAAQIPGPDTWLELENGVQIQFVDPTATYRPGDYWLIPARVATGDVEWPTETIPADQNTTVNNPVALPPDGVEHHYAPLAIVNIDGASVGVTECRSRIAGATLLPPPLPVPFPIPAPQAKARSAKRSAASRSPTSKS